MDLHVKKTIVGDSILMAKKNKRKIKELNVFKSLSRIFPNTDDEASIVNDTIIKMRELFYIIVPIK